MDVALTYINGIAGVTLEPNKVQQNKIEQVMFNMVFWFFTLSNYYFTLPGCWVVEQNAIICQAKAIIW